MSVVKRATSERNRVELLHITVLTENSRSYFSGRAETRFLHKAFTLLRPPARVHDVGKTQNSLLHIFVLVSYFSERERK